MEEQFNKIEKVIYSITNYHHVEACEVLIKQFNKRYQDKGHDYSRILLGMLEATKTIKLTK